MEGRRGRDPVPAGCVRVCVIRRRRLPEALAHVRSIRRWVMPNDGFMAQLLAYEAQLLGPRPPSPPTAD